MKCYSVRTLDDVRESRAAVLSRTDVATVMGIDLRTVNKGIADGTIPSLKVGTKVLVPRESFLTLFDVIDRCSE